MAVCFHWKKKDEQRRVRNKGHGNGGEVTVSRQLLEAGTSGERMITVGRYSARPASSTQTSNVINHFRR
jgi:hypothetical protein